LDISKMRSEARELTGALHVMVTNRSVPVEYAVAADLDTEATRQVRERRILEDLIARDSRFRDRAPRLAGLILEAKQRVLDDEAPERVLEMIEQALDDEERAAAESRDGSAAAPSAGDAELVATAAALSALERNAVS
jgi:septation ring formation regulator EzrA